MSRVESALEAARLRDPSLCGLYGALGKNPTRSPPTEGSVSHIRVELAVALGIAPECAGLHHPASPLRYRLAGEIRTQGADPDEVFGRVAA